MAQNQKDKMELLQRIFDNVNHWLHFAEAKNAALTAFNVALMASIIETDLFQEYFLCATLLVTGLIASAIAAIWSFKPINKKLEKTSKGEANENLLHFAYIASLEQDEYAKKLYNRYWGEKDKDIAHVPPLERDYCEEIVENARITMRKQKWFKISFYIDLGVLIFLGVLFICA